MRVLTWNLFHGRSVAGAGRSLEREFAAALAGWEWDVALLQEVPPWWPVRLAAAAGATHATALTSRNALLPLRRALAERAPDVMRSGGGGANAILVRGEPIAVHARRRLRLWPERRVAHAVRLASSGIWVANLHAQAHSDERACADLALAARTVLRWAGRDAAIVLGGDLNVRRPRADGFVLAGGHDVDHLLARGLRRAGDARVPARRDLSDHAPVVVAFERPAGATRQDGGTPDPEGFRA
jgi:endonuclease/exonuclease/phosphatase family metal-dependent hydrolase